MAENEDGLERSEQPTPKRLDDARRKGQVARSRELNTMAVTLSGALLLSLAGGRMGEGLADLMGSSFDLSRSEIFDPAAMLEHLVAALREALLILLPVLFVTLIAAISASTLLGGLTFSAKAIVPKLSKLNPAKGLKRMFSLKSLLELFKALVKFLLIGGVTLLILKYFADELLMLGQMDVAPALSSLGDIIAKSIVILAASLVLLAAVDVPFQLWEHNRQLKMTRQEVKDEMKETDGRPEVKGRIRSLQREMAQRRMMEEVPKADVIVTNPTHFAVALGYDQSRMSAPKVIAKGSDLIAHNIRRIGAEAKVPVLEAPLLARAIYFNSEVGDQIPAGLYLAVAKLLAYVFQLRVYMAQGGEAPVMPDDLPVPEDYRTESRL